MSTKQKHAGAKKQVDSWKQKEWYDVYAPKMFEESFIGSVPSASPDTVKNRVIETILYYLTDNMSDISTKLRFKITSVAQTKCTSQFYGHDTTRDYIRSMVRRGSSRIDGMFNITTANGVKMRISVSVFTNGRAKASQQTTMRKIIRDVLNEHAKAENFAKFVHGIVFGRIAQNIFNIAKEIYIIRECRVRKSKVLTLAEDLPDEKLAETEEFKPVAPEVKKHRKSVLKKLVKETKEAVEKEAGAAEPGKEEGEKTEEKGEETPKEEKNE